MPTRARRNGHYIMRPHSAPGRRQIRAVSVDGADSEKGRGTRPPTGAPAAAGPAGGPGARGGCGFAVATESLRGGGQGRCSCGGWNSASRAAQDKEAGPRAQTAPEKRARSLCGKAGASRLRRRRRRFPRGRERGSSGVGGLALAKKKGEQRRGKRAVNVPEPAAAVVAVVSL